MTKFGVAMQMYPVTALLAIGFVAGCDEDWAKKLDTGTVVPNFRLQVELSKASSKRQLYDSFVDVSSRVGFHKHIGEHVFNTDFTGDKKTVRSFNWVPGGSDERQYRLRFTWEVDKGLDFFTVMFVNSDTSDFEREEWVYYKRLRYEILPTVYPSARITTTRHPVVYTDEKVAQGLFRSLGLEDFEVGGG